MTYDRTSWQNLRIHPPDALNLDKLEAAVDALDAAMVALQLLLANVALEGTELRIGGESNYLAIEADGSIELNGDAVMWEDLRIVPGSFDRPGASDPTMVSYQPGGSGTATYLWQWAKNNLASFTIQLPHSYKTGTPVYCHAHWTPGPKGVAESGAFVGWKLDYSWANINGAFGVMSTLDLSDACDGTDHKHQMTPDVVIAGDEKGISSMLICNFKRTDTGGDDTWSGSTSGNLPLLLEIDFHFQIDTLGSRLISSK